MEALWKYSCIECMGITKFVRNFMFLQGAQTKTRVSLAVYINTGYIQKGDSLSHFSALKITITTQISGAEDYKSN